MSMHGVNPSDARLLGPSNRRGEEMWAISRLPRFAITSDGTTVSSIHP